MTTSVSPAAPQQPVRYKRSYKNYLIDTRFQLKYTGFIIAVALVISAVLGTVLWRTSQRLVAQSAAVVEESKKVSEVVKMNIKDDPVFGADPDLMKAFTSSATQSDEQIAKQQQQLIDQQHTVITTLFASLAVMVVLIGIMGILFTHKVAGPMHMMKNLLRQVGGGRLTFDRKPRKGDDKSVQEFFNTFNAMVEQLKDRQRKECELLEGAIEKARSSGASEEAINNIIVVRDEMRAALEK